MNIFDLLYLHIISIKRKLHRYDIKSINSTAFLFFPRLKLRLNEIKSGTFFIRLKLNARKTPAVIFTRLPLNDRKRSLMPYFFQYQLEQKKISIFLMLYRQMLIPYSRFTCLVGILFLTYAIYGH